jgi:predicted DNA-binding transcriptional regulator AlpA
MPKIPAEQISPHELGAEPVPVNSPTTRPKRRTRGEPGAARAPPLVALLSTAQTARYLNVCTRTLLRWIRAGGFPAPIHLAPGAHPRWLIRDLDNWISKRAATRHQRPALRGALAQLENREEPAKRTRGRGRADAE